MHDCNIFSDLLLAVMYLSHKISYLPKENDLEDVIMNFYIVLYKKEVWQV